MFLFDVGVCVVLILGVYFIDKGISFWKVGLLMDIEGMGEV